MLEFSHVPFIVLDMESSEGGALDGILGMNFFWNRNIVLEPTTTGGGLPARVRSRPVRLHRREFRRCGGYRGLRGLRVGLGRDAGRSGVEQPCDFYLDEVIDARDLEAFVDSWMNMLGQ